jgi:dihydrofolate reductase
MRSKIQTEELRPAMGKLIYTAITSLDGFIEDADGHFDWAAPDEEVHAFVNDLERPIGTYLYGRRMYETMVFWETAATGDDQSAIFRDYAEIWRGAEKVVFSRTLEMASSARTRVEANFDTEVIRQTKGSATGDLAIGGAALAALAFRAKLIDECHLFLNPILVGGGKQALPSNVRTRLELLDEGRFGNGVVHLHYRVTN